MPAAQSQTSSCHSGRLAMSTWWLAGSNGIGPTALDHTDSGCCSGFGRGMYFVIVEWPLPSRAARWYSATRSTGARTRTGQRRMAGVMGVGLGCCCY